MSNTPTLSQNIHYLCVQNLGTRYSHKLENKAVEQYIPGMQNAA